TEEPAPPAAEPRTPARRRRATRATAAPAEAADDADVAASLAELAHQERTRTRRRVKAEAFGLTEEATPDQVLDSLAAAIGGLLSEEPEVEEDAEDVEEVAEDDEDEDAADLAEDEAGEGDGTTPRRRRRRRGEDAGDGEEDGVDVVVRVREPRRRSTASDEVTGIEGSTRMEAKKQRRREGRAAGRRRTPILSESEFLARREAVERTMLIRQADDYSQIAVMEDGVLVEHYVDRASATSMIGNIYLGRVQNVLPSMEAAFVDIGRGRNAVLYAGEVDWESFGVTGQDKKVERVFKSGQQVLVQVSKDPVGAKGARLTSHISIPGRYIVYSPGGHLSGISRKLPEGERRRLKGILDELIGSEASVIVRTAAEGASEEELVRDVNRLKAQWE
ncbi:MAG: ribonuclease E/G, partial [Actinobacteria bacterium]|nr:ribonuclease E/G [Actinomycetota bacterium]